MGQGLSLIGSIAVPLAGGLIGALASQKDVVTWYAKIKKPRWTPPSSLIPTLCTPQPQSRPPNFLFGPVWSVLYVSMGTASWFIFRKKGKGRMDAVALSLYAAQLVFNLAWNPLFFKTHKTDVALIDISALLGLATAATVTMSIAHKPAVQLPLMVPYLVWVSYATALNAAILAKNPEERLFKGRKQKAADAKAEKDSAKPASAVKEAVVAAKDAAAAVSAGSKAVEAASAAVQHGAEAAKPVVAAAEGAKHALDSAVGAVKSTGAAVGVTGPAAPAPSASAGSTPASMAPASKAIAAEVEKASAAAPSPAGTESEAGGSVAGAAKAMQKELEAAGAI
ncbi:hypothetical protein HYH03_013204 [Edaphochlamys debaryana]|uniref:Uncharacterized protein n=1 Tax=Edaphochlamys debaryana TaxID=47281 RepID=A0A835XWN6_9CHLO|nr:hypothetical protein HYH03_013204 [Edaphochlamys debaryana]|eukprot:KAG2488210.1 hypothetical protein HYH03_013204 [Edaphochlamys debaryana]